MTRISLVLFVVFLFSLSAVSQKISQGFSKVIYDTDGRTDTYELDTYDQALGRSTVVVITGFNVLTDNGDGSYSATSTATAENFWDFCPDERFSQQVILSHGIGFCSGFLITDQWVGTAAHCSLSPPGEYIVIFGFELTSKSTTRLEFTADDVYSVHDIVSVGTPSGDANDYGILELDRPVTKYQPYTKINNHMKIGDPLTLIGHPMGLPKKTDKGGVVTGVTTSVIRGTVDSYGGNSGSPVFDQNGLLAGILVGGSQDFQYHADCETSNVCPGHSGCEILGEYIVPICSLIASSTDVEERIGIDCNEVLTSGEFTYSSELVGVLEADFSSPAAIVAVSPFLLVIGLLCAILI